MIELAGLSKRYGDFAAVQGLSLRVERGEVFGFLGPNGAGKTTTINMLMGILVPSAGTAHLDGLDCQRARVEVKRRVGYCPDTPVFYAYLRGREIVEFVAEMHGQDRFQARSRAGALLEMLHLGEAAEEFAVNYSMGMRKKLALACALVHDPPVLILDEPTNGLDPRAAREVQDFLRTSAQAGKTIFLSTHLLDMAERLCDRLGIIHQGVLMAAGSPDALRSEAQAAGTDASLEALFLRLTGPTESRP